MSSNEFNTDALKTFFEHKSSFAEHKVKLDAVSQDIRKVERILQENGITKEFRMIAEDSIHHRELIGWIKEDKQRYRLVYIRQFSQWEGEDWRDVETRPLIETKADVRLRLVHSLTPFLSMLHDSAGLTERPKFSLGDIPF